MKNIDYLKVEISPHPSFLSKGEVSVKVGIQGIVCGKKVENFHVHQLISKEDIFDSGYDILFGFLKHKLKEYILKYEEKEENVEKKKD